MKRFLNLLLLNILWIICSLPLITIGASTCGAFYVSMKIVDNKECNIFKDFFKGFKTNFKQGTILWAFTAPCIYALYIIWPMILNGDAGLVGIAGAVVFSMLFVFSFLYSYPMVSRYENRLKKIVKNSVLVCAQFFKKTLILIAILAVEILFFVIIKNYFIFALLIAPEIIIYTISIFAKRIFNNLEKIAKVQREAVKSEESESN